MYTDNTLSTRFRLGTLRRTYTRVIIITISTKCDEHCDGRHPWATEKRQ